VRQQLNENPVAQAVLIGVLVLVVGFLLFTRVFSSGSSEPAPASTSTTPATETTASTAESTAAAPAETGAAPVADTPTGEFVAGPGLPAEVVKAYADGKVVVVFVLRKGGVDDKPLKKMVQRLRRRGDTAVFVTPASEIARYSRITQGVDLQRVPALVVLTPRKLNDGGPPVASIRYGFRGPESVNQAVQDALYKGRSDIPYHPE
jgi:hypothetical protein